MMGINFLTMSTLMLAYQAAIMISFTEGVRAEGSCGKLYLGENDTFSSPNYPSEYGPNEKCTWIITVPEGYVPIIRFQRFDLERCYKCCCDFLKVFDGPDSTSPMVGPLCSDYQPEIIYATKNKMYVIFQADGAVQSQGFSATISKVEVFREDIVADNGTIQRPNNTNNHDPLQRYEWSVTVPEKYQISVSILSLGLPRSIECIKGFLEIRDGSEPTSSILKKFCSTDSVTNVESSGNKIYIVFQSDNSEVPKEFLAIFRKVNACNEILIGDNGTFHTPNYPNRYGPRQKCRWTIKVPEDNEIILRFLDFKLPLSTFCRKDYVTISYKSYRTRRINLRLCGTDAPNFVRSDGNEMTITFESDNWEEEKGFMAEFRRADICNEIITGDNGTIHTPNYPDNYGPMARCYWIIIVPEGHKIVLKFLAFELQYYHGCAKDALQVYSGTWRFQLYDKLCGTNVPNYIQSYENKMTITFESDDNYEAKGFLAEFKKVDICQEVLIGDNGTLHTPNHPNNYGPVERCRWTIEVPEDHQIILRFLTFDVPWSEYCKKDFVEIRDSNQRNGRRLGKFCGSNLPSDIRSETNVITVEFWSDDSQEGNGFKAFFKKTSCGENFNSESGAFHSPNYPNPYRAYELCVWKITVPDNYGVTILFQSLQLGVSFSCWSGSVTVYDGHSPSSAVLGKYCGERVPGKIHSSNNTMSVRFTTGAIDGKSGFSAVFTKAQLPSSRSSFPSAPSPCHHDFQSDSGTLLSPQYPLPYPPLTNCTWNIQVPKGKIIRLEFQSFDLEDGIGSLCPYDNVTVYEGNPTSPPFRLSTFCGAERPEILWFDGNIMTVLLVTDNSFQHQGFSATFTKGDTLRKILTADSGTLVTPNHPNNYGSSQKCIWTISFQDNCIIFLKFLTFDVEYSENCTNDFVDIYDGSISARRVGRFCGSQTPLDIRSTVNSMTIVFATDTSEEGRGFSAEYQKEVICTHGSCRNGAKCEINAITNVMECSCKHGYQGRLCEKPILCTSDSCEHGGSCFQNGTRGTFHCVCEHGYEGLTCGERSLCGKETCQNGGYCTHGGKNGVFLCVCEPGFEGHWCEKATEVFGGKLAAILAPLITILVIAAFVIFFLLIRRRRKQQSCGDISHM